MTTAAASDDNGSDDAYLPNGNKSQHAHGANSDDLLWWDTALDSWLCTSNFRMGLEGSGGNEAHIATYLGISEKSTSLMSSSGSMEHTI